MFKYWKEYQRIKNGIKMLHEMQKENITDDYSCGLYNGIELCMAIVDGREVEFATFEKEPENIEAEEQQGRTIASGVIRR